MLRKEQTELLRAEGRTKKRLQAALALALLWPRRRPPDEVARVILLSRQDAADAGARLAAKAARAEQPVAYSLRAQYEQFRANRAAKALTENLHRDGYDARRVDVTATSETADAFSRGATAQARAIELDTGVDLWRVWVCEGAHPCDLCEAHDGERVRVNENFDGGDEPGMHPSCRCVVVIET